MKAYNKGVAKVLTKAKGVTNGSRKTAAVSKLGRDLRRLSDQYFKSGGKHLTREEIEREVAERRGASSTLVC